MSPQEANALARWLRARTLEPAPPGTDPLVESALSKLADAIAELPGAASAPGMPTPTQSHEEPETLDGLPMSGAFPTGAAAREGRQ